MVASSSRWCRRPFTSDCRALLSPGMLTLFQRCLATYWARWICSVFPAFEVEWGGKGYQSLHWEGKRAAMLEDQTWSSSTPDLRVLILLLCKRFVRKCNNSESAIMPIDRPIPYVSSAVTFCMTLRSPCKQCTYSYICIQHWEILHQSF